MKKVVSAGGIVVRNNPKKQILLTIYTNIKGLGFAKGHVEPGETFKQAAIREVTEETGVSDLKIIKKLGVIKREATERDGTPVLKDIHIYLMISKNPDLHQNSQELYDWFEVEDAIKQMAVAEDADFLKSILNNI